VIRIAIEPIVSLGPVESLWTSLDSRGSHSFFTTWNWIGCWLAALPPRFEPRLVTATRAGETVAAAILIPRRTRRHGIVSASQLHFNSTGEAAFDCITIEHNGFTGPSHAEPELWRALMNWFAEGAGGTDELIIPGVEEQMLEDFRGSELLFASQEAPAFRTPLKAVVEKDGIEACLSRNARQQLRRSIRAYRAIGELELDEASTVERALDYFTALKLLHIRSWARRGVPHAFRHSFFETFHRALIARGTPQGLVQMLRVTAGARPIGYLYNFRYRGRVYAYQSGFEDSDPGFRPGYVCHTLAIDAAAASGAEDYDFLAGRNRLKQSLAAEEYVMSWCAIRQPKLKFRAERAARSVAKRIADGLRR
jgi:CelD/BcsL family acetyltransferase involved in cellulose biosynthesis